jgi:hypothetical protein
VTEAKTTTARKTAAQKREEETVDALNIYQIIPKVREEVGIVAKDQQPTSGTRYNYRSTDQIINAIVPILNKYGVFTTVWDDLIEYGSKEIVNTRQSGQQYTQILTHAVIQKVVRFYATDGSHVESRVIGESSDYSDKATGSAETYAYRQALVQTFTIPTGDDPEGRGSQTEHDGTPARAVAQTAPVQQKPVTDERKDLLGKIYVTLRDAGQIEAGLSFEDAVAKIKPIGEKVMGTRPNESWIDTLPGVRAYAKKLEAGEVG